MLNISTELKELYKSNNIPKVYDIYFPELDLHINSPGTNNKIVQGSFELKESICSDKDLTLGACEAAMVKLTVANLIQDLSGYSFILTQTINGTYQMPLGSYKVDSCKKQNDLWFREITAYDDMKKTDVDVVTWYNSLAWPQTVKSLRESLLTYLGIQFKDQTLNNDDVQLAKTLDPSSLLGRDVLRRICEINAGFGHITREGKFKVIQLAGLGLYPSETLHPAEDLFPAESSETMTAGYKQIDYEEYIVEPITQLQIKQEDGDVGVTVGEEGNLYVISENFLLYGKTAAELEDIANNILLQVKNKYYRPHNTVCIGLPYIEVGDAITIITSNDAIETFIFTRTLTGIQALEDEFTATGNRKRDNKVSLSTQVEQLKGRTLKIQKSVDGVQMDVTDLDLQLTSEMNFLAGQVELKVDAAGVISAINLSPENATIRANKINFNGYATFDVNGNLTTIDGSVLKTGTVVADMVRAGWVYAGNISANQINGGVITGVKFISTGSGRTITIDNGYISANYIEINSLQSVNISCLYINNGTPITTSNMSAASVGYADEAGSVPGIATNQISASNTGYGNIDFLGFDNAAAVNWVQSNYQPITPSDVRLKYDFKSLDEIPDEVFYSLKPYQFRYKTPIYGEEIFFGVIGQEVESNFETHGLNPYDYDLIEVKDVRAYTDDGFYVEDTTHRIHYNNFIAWLIRIVQKQNDRISELEKIINT